VTLLRVLVIAILTTATATFVAAGAGAGRAPAAPPCVGSKPGCYTTIQAAVDAAQENDGIVVGPGTYAGGVVIDKSIQLKGAGAEATVISGGGPVLTIGVDGAASEPTVSISGVTIRDGVNAGDPTFVVGGGILIPKGAGGSTGASVTVTDSVITDNRATPTVAAPIGPPCPGGPCGFARGDGGGIASWGKLTLLRTTVSQNVAGGPVASDAHGGGIWSAGVATLTLKNSAVTGNGSLVVPPNGRFAIGGGVHIQNGGSLEIANSVVRGNTASLTSSLPGGIDMISNGGGIHVGDDSSVTIENTRIDGNSVVVDDVSGQPAGFDAGMIVGASTLVLRNSTIDGNRVVANVAATDDNGSSGSALEFDGTATIANTRITDNSTTVTSAAGNAAAVGAISAFGQGSASRISNSLVSGNTVSASTASGSATVQGAALANNGPLELRNVQIVDNAATASGPTGYVQGGGIWNGVVFNPPPVQLTLVNTAVMHNVVSGSAGLAVAGGGLFSQFPVALDHTRIERNTPDDDVCVGC
jgi:hypothetical protein